MTSAPRASVCGGVACDDDVDVKPVGSLTPSTFYSVRAVQRVPIPVAAPPATWRQGSSRAPPRSQVRAPHLPGSPMRRRLTRQGSWVLVPPAHTHRRSPCTLSRSPSLATRRAQPHQPRLWRRPAPVAQRTSIRRTQGSGEKPRSGCGSARSSDITPGPSVSLQYLQVFPCNCGGLDGGGGRSTNSAVDEDGSQAQSVRMPDPVQVHSHR